MVMHCTSGAESISEVVPRNVPRRSAVRVPVAKKRAARNHRTTCLNDAHDFWRFVPERSSGWIKTDVHVLKTMARIGCNPNYCTCFFLKFPPKNDSAGTSGSPICWWEIFRLTFGQRWWRWRVTLPQLPPLWGGRLDAALFHLCERWCCQGGWAMVFTFFMVPGVDVGNQKLIERVQTWLIFGKTWLKSRGWRGMEAKLGGLDFWGFICICHMSSGTSSPSKTLPAAMNPGLPAVLSGKNCHLHPMDWNISMLGLVAEADARAAYLLWVPRVALLWSELVAFCSLMDSGPLLSSLSDDQTCGMVTFNKLWYLSKI